MLKADLHSLTSAVGFVGKRDGRVGLTTGGETAGGPGLTSARLYPDYGGSPLWLPNRRVEWEEIRVSQLLRWRLEAWVNEALHDAGSVSTDDDFDAEGHELARLLSDELNWSVFYEIEANDIPPDRP